MASRPQRKGRIARGQRIAARLGTGLCVATLCSVALANDGQLDTTFGSGGIALAGVSDAAGQAGCAPVVQADHKILTCGTRAANGSSGKDFVVVRFGADGSLDTSFSFDGVATIDFDNGHGRDRGTGLALQSDGKIVVVGSTTTATGSSTHFAIARLDADGTLDTTFGAGTGKTTVEFNLVGGTVTDAATSVAIQPDGKIVVSGYAETANGGTNVAIVRLLSDGTRDSSFNLTGKVHFNFGLAGANNIQDAAVGVVVDAAGRIVLAGAALSFNPDRFEFGVARLLPNGQLDANFHANGRTTIAFDPGNGTSFAHLSGMTTQRDGRIVLTGYANSSTSTTTLNNDGAVARLLPDGSLDGSFGFGGKVLVSFDLAPNADDVLYSVSQQQDGKLVFAGVSLGATGQQYATLARLNSDGSPDPTFGTLGKQALDFARTTPSVQPLTGIALQGVQPVATGFVKTGATTQDLFAVRFTSDTIFANDFE